MLQPVSRPDMLTELTTCTSDVMGDYVIPMTSSRDPRMGRRRLAV